MLRILIFLSVPRFSAEEMVFKFCKYFDRYTVNFDVSKPNWICFCSCLLIDINSSCILFRVFSDVCMRKLANLQFELEMHQMTMSLTET